LLKEWSFHQDASHQDLFRWETDIAIIWNTAIESVFLLYCDQFRTWKKYYQPFSVIDMQLILYLIKNRWHCLVPTLNSDILNSMKEQDAKFSFFDCDLRVYDKIFNLKEIGLDNSDLGIIYQNSKDIFDFSLEFYKSCDLNSVFVSTI
jgi:hypothetical protein